MSDREPRQPDRATHGPKHSPDLTRLFGAPFPDGLDDGPLQPLLQVPDDLMGKSLAELFAEIRFAVQREVPSATTNGLETETVVVGSEVEASAGASGPRGFLPFLWGLLRQGGRSHDEPA